jgi:ribulose-5-phosphate 4-epimerase/fuculose-1-phosphate aldolase
VNSLADTPPVSAGPVDRALIDDLVAASRILAHYGVLDAWGHVSIRHPKNRAFLERFIHGQAYRARPDVNAVVHSHSPTMIPFSVTGEPLRGISHIASFLCEEVPLWEIRDCGMTQGLLVTNNTQGASLAKTLGKGPVALMRGHGNVVVAPDIRRAVHRALYTEVNAQQLATALSFKRPIKYIAPDEMQDPKRLDDSWEVWKAEALKEA